MIRIESPLEALRLVLGAQTADLVAQIASVADSAGMRLALVGGVVRDLRLSEPTTDLDWLVDSEGRQDSAVRFARALAQALGGTIDAHAVFGTATWTPAEAVDGLPHHIDFATARTETYAHPGALPTVTPTTLEDDLRRRDFSVNAMALILSPLSDRGLLIDPHDGLDDLARGVLRALHARSFIDDPTRILRAARLAARLSLSMDAKTAALIPDALAIFDVLSGERIRTELGLILRDPRGLAGLHLLQSWGVLTQIHPKLGLPDSLDSALWQQTHHQDTTPQIRDAALWCAWLRFLTPAQAESVALRLMFPAPLIQAVVAAAELTADPGFAPTDPPSRIYRALIVHPNLTLEALALVDSGLLGKSARNASKYWNGIKTVTTGNTLKALSIPQGPRYKYILDTLKDAWIDGRISSPEEEQAALDQLLKDPSNDAGA